MLPYLITSNEDSVALLEELTKLRQGVEAFQAVRLVLQVKCNIDSATYREVGGNPLNFAEDREKVEVAIFAPERGNRPVVQEQWIAYLPPTIIRTGGLWGPSPRFPVRVSVEPLLSRLRLTLEKGTR